MCFKRKRREARTANIGFVIAEVRKLFPIFLFLVACGQPGEQKNDWTTSDTYFQVYNFSENVMGLTVELGYTQSTEIAFIDSIFEQIATTDSIDYIITQQVSSCIPIDTNGQFRFYRNVKLENNLLAGVDKNFFVYCTKGIVQQKIKDVVFALDECQSNIVVFRFDKIDTNQYGQPMFCSKTKMNLTFENSSVIDNKIETFHQTQQYDYADSLKSVSYAHLDSLYFAYTDDFNWNKPSDIDNYFPGRAIYVLQQDGKIYCKWALSLDLFGIPCD